MKAKTVWKTSNDGVSYWRYESGLIWFSSKADVRWVNCFGENVDSKLRMKLGSNGKILGDSDE